MLRKNIMKFYRAPNVIKIYALTFPNTQCNNVASRFSFFAIKPKIVNQLININIALPLCVPVIHKMLPVSRPF